MRRLFQNDNSLKTEGITEFLEASGIAQFLKDTEINSERLKHYSFRINNNIFTGNYIDISNFIKSSFSITVTDQNHVCVNFSEKRSSPSDSSINRWSIHQKITEFTYEDDAVTVITGTRNSQDFIKDCNSIEDLQELSDEQDIKFEADIYPIRKMPNLNNLIKVSSKEMSTKEFRK